ncbi:MAG: hypothetical protein A3E87_07150 [Gammaproteobacteria bacterium RIFCSPHIGHO2_12_FULL_35_23]|nr:MAG: hypothetical protein A3E87_07150 [Gammaproteobacteria bacterium RIFCSPHIGHO2_12_FULL_35_23]
MRTSETGRLTALKVLGLAGIDYRENATAHYWGRFFTWPMLTMAFWLIIQWFLEDHQVISPELSNLLSWLIWFAFVCETTILTYVVDNKFRYLRDNWMNLFIIASAIPVVWGVMPMTVMLRTLRIIIIPKLIIHWWRH